MTSVRDPRTGVLRCPRGHTHHSEPCPVCVKKDEEEAERREELSRTCMVCGHVRPTPGERRLKAFLGFCSLIGIFFVIYLAFNPLLIVEALLGHDTAARVAKYWHDLMNR